METEEPIALLNSTDSRKRSRETSEEPESPCKSSRKQNNSKENDEKTLEIKSKKYIHRKDASKILQKKIGSIETTHIKVVQESRDKHIIFVSFQSKEDKESAKLLLQQNPDYKGKPLEIKDAKTRSDPLEKRRKDEENGAQPERKAKTVLEATAAYGHLTYDEQIKQKEKDCLKFLEKYGKVLEEEKNEISCLITEAKKENNNLPCKWLGFHASPEIDGYRNKVEFAVGYNANGGKEVGFRVGKYSDGSFEVASPDETPHVPDIAKRAAKLFLEYVKSSKHDVYHTRLQVGVFKQLTVRYAATTNELMLIFGIISSHLKTNSDEVKKELKVWPDTTLNQDLCKESLAERPPTPESVTKSNDTDDEFDELKLSLKEYFTNGAGSELKVTSLYIDLQDQREKDDPFPRGIHVWGATKIHEKLLDYKFGIRPMSFFQVNTKAAEVLYTLAMQMGKVDENTEVFDLCCGTGTIGITFLKHCKKVHGVDNNFQATKDCEENLKMNGLNNYAIHWNPVQTMLPVFINSVNKNDKMLAILDPPRAGLPNVCIKTLRNARRIERFIYIACKPSAALQDWIQFGRNTSQQYHGDQFILKEAAGVDMFPHTEHSEMILLFERVTDAEKSKCDQHRTEKTSRTSTSKTSASVAPTSNQ